MRPRSQTMSENVGVMAASPLQGICQFWHPVEGSLVVNRLRQRDDGWDEQRRVVGGRAKWIADDVPQKSALLGLFSFICGVPDFWIIRQVGGTTCCPCGGEPRFQRILHARGFPSLPITFVFLTIGFVIGVQAIRVNGVRYGYG